jgi:AcrR family transcriptional regulator
VSPKKPRMTDLAESRIKEITDVALRLFAQNGYHSTTLDEVAAKIGVTKATLYYYFNSKEELLRAILNRSLSRMQIALSLEKSTLSTAGKLRRFIEYTVEFSANAAELAKITFEQVEALPKRSRDAVKRKERKLDTLLKNILEQGVEEGILDIDNIKIVSYAIIGMCNSTYHWYKPEGKLAPRQISEIYIKLLENGYFKKLPCPEANDLGETPEIDIREKATRRK